MPKKPSKIALFIPGLYGGGAEDVVLKLAKGFRERGTEAELVVVANEGELKSRVPDHVRLVDLGTSRIIFSLFPLIRYLREARPDVLFSALTPTNVVALLANWMLGQKISVIISEQNTNLPSWSEGGAKGLVLRFLIQITYPMSSIITCVSEAVAEEVSKALDVPKEDFSVIYQPVVTRELFDLATQEVDHPWFYEDPPVILGVGRLTAQKDFPTLLRAFARVRSEHDSRLILFGEGEERFNLECLLSDLGIEDAVDMPGFVDNPIKYMANADLFVLSSAWEGFGIVIVEALASGVPVVSTCPDDGPGEILEGGKYGRLVSSGNEQALADAILEALDHPEEPASKQQRQERAMDFTVENAVNQYWSIVKQYV